MEIILFGMFLGHLSLLSEVVMEILQGITEAVEVEVAVILGQVVLVLRVETGETVGVLWAVELVEEVQEVILPVLLVTMVQTVVLVFPI